MHEKIFFWDFKKFLPGFSSFLIKAKNFQEKFHHIWIFSYMFGITICVKVRRLLQRHTNISHKSIVSTHSTLLSWDLRKVFFFSRFSSCNEVPAHSKTLPFIFITLNIEIFTISFSFRLLRGKVVHLGLANYFRTLWIFFSWHKDLSEE